MGLFKNREGGLMDVIRCDKTEYLVVYILQKIQNIAIYFLKTY